MLEEWKTWYHLLNISLFSLIFIEVKEKLIFLKLKKCNFGSLWEFYYNLSNICCKIIKEMMKATTTMLLPFLLLATLSFIWMNMITLISSFYIGGKEIYECCHYIFLIYSPLKLNIYYLQSKYFIYCYLKVFVYEVLINLFSFLEN